jgi:hypothetical protein
MKKSLLTFLCLGCILQTLAQSANINRGLDDAYQLERLDILNERISDTLHTDLNAIPMKDKVAFLEMYLQKNKALLSESEVFDIKRMIAKNAEYASSDDAWQKSKKPILKSFYKYKSDFLNVKGSNFDLVLNPVLAYQQMVETGNTNQTLFYNSRGLELRGNIAKRIAFYTVFTDNQERGPLHFQNYNATHNAVQGHKYFKEFKKEKPGNARDYIYAAGYFDASVIKNTMNISFGHDRFQIGDGYRSLFLGDQGANYLFAKINTRLGRFNYQNLFMELTPTYLRAGDRILPKKYAAMHHLSMRVGKWMQLGLFESVVFGRENPSHFEFQYMNPIILYRSIEQALGSPDNAMVGMNFKINTRFKTQFYGQVALDEFKFSELAARNGWWANKYGLQAGIKVADPIGIKNLMIQAELNVVRPFTYTFRDSVANHTNYNQELAHIYGANFADANLIVRYKPMKKLYLTWKTIYNRQGRDTSSTGFTFGGNIFRDYDQRNAKYGVKLLNGFASTVMFTNVNASYEIKDNLFVDLGLNYRDETASTKKQPTFSSVQVYTGFRLNAARRQYDY